MSRFMLEDEGRMTARLSRDLVEDGNKILNGEFVDGAEAECTKHNPEAWFPADDKKESRALPKRICQGCDLRPACLEAALAMEGGRSATSRWGVWGGLDESERAALARKRRRAEQ